MNINGDIKIKDTDLTLNDLINKINGTIIYNGTGALSVTPETGDLFSNYRELLIYVGWYSNSPTPYLIKYQEGGVYGVSSCFYQTSSSIYWGALGQLTITSSNISISHGYQFNYTSPSNGSGFYNCCRITKIVGYK